MLTTTEPRRKETASSWLLNQINTFSLSPSIGRGPEEEFLVLSDLLLPFNGAWINECPLKQEEEEILTRRSLIIFYLWPLPDPRCLPVTFLPFLGIKRRLRQWQSKVERMI